MKEYVNNFGPLTLHFFHPLNFFHPSIVAKEIFIEQWIKIPIYYLLYSWSRQSGYPCYGDEILI